MTSAMRRTTWWMVSSFSSISSPMRMTLGWVWKATSRAMWEALRPMRRLKCQYFRSDLQSELRLPISVAKAMQAEWYPKGICSSPGTWRSPSMVLGMPMTWVPDSRRFSARKAALVLESSPPTTTRPSSFRAAQVCRHCSIFWGVSILSRPVPSM